MAPRNAHSFVVKAITHPGPPGAIQVRYHGGKPAGLAHACPCGCGMWGWMNFKEYGFDKYWERTSDDWEHLTLTPSIGFMKDKTTGQYHWHGYLRGGVFEEC